MAGSAQRWCRTLACCCSFEDDDIFSRVGTVVASVFHDTDRAGLGATDLGAAMLLVRYMQLQQRREDPHGFATGLMERDDHAAAPPIWSGTYGEDHWAPIGTD